MKKKPSEFNGIVVVDKPAGVTSHDIVDAARRLYQTRRVGHTGTLDPDATGVLVLCLGYATRLAEYLSASKKNYIAEVKFGVESDSQDASGQITATRDAAHFTEADLAALLPRFRGTIEQIPPMVSALHHEGKRLYELAREGITVERDARPVQIDRLELLNFAPGTHPLAKLEITCSTGTYIRTLAADLGAAAGTGALMQSLRRTWVGASENDFNLTNARTLDELRAKFDDGTLGETVLTLAEALKSWPRIALDDAEIARVRSGQAIARPELFPDSEVLLVAVLNPQGEMIAVARYETGAVRPVKVLN